MTYHASLICWPQFAALWRLRTMAKFQISHLWTSPRPSMGFPTSHFTITLKAMVLLVSCYKSYGAFYSVRRRLLTTNASHCGGTTKLGAGPILFLVCIRDLPQTLSVIIAMYADDVTVWCPIPSSCNPPSKTPGDRPKIGAFSLTTTD